MKVVASRRGTHTGTSSSSRTPKLHTSRNFHQPMKYSRIAKEDPVISSHVQDAICLP